MRTAIWDIETGGLNPGFDWVFCSSLAILGADNEVAEVRTLRLDEYLVHDRDLAYKGRAAFCDLTNDSKLVAEIVSAFEGVDHLVTWNGKRFDMRFIKARQIIWAARGAVVERAIPKLWHTDCLPIWRYHFGTRGARLVQVERFLDLAEHKTPLDERTWGLAKIGHEPSMDKVVEHNIQDVIVLAEVYRRMLPFIGQVQRQG